MPLSASRRGSSLPAVLVALAVASTLAYLVFFRRGAPPEAPAPAVRVEVREEASPAAHAPAPVAEAKPAPEKPLEAPALKRSEAPASGPAQAAAKADAGAAPAAFPPSAKADATPVPAVRPPEPAAPRNELDALLAEGKWREARARLAALFAGALPDAERTELARKGIEINRRLLLDQPDERDIEYYEIQQGDTLEGIARKFKQYNGVKGIVMLINNYKENSILRAGRKVRVTRGAWSVLVDKSLFQLWLCYEGAPFKAYRVTIGADRKDTPAGKFAVGTRNPKPSWWPPADAGLRGPVPYGDPKNPLGEYWISLEHDLHHGLGIHGTNDPASIGSRASNGCVRMLNEEVVEIAAISFKGMPVSIVE